MTTDITLLGTGSPIADPNRAGPATLVQAGGEHYLIDCGRGVLMRLAAAGVPIGQLTALCITHLHSDHITDLNDVITTMWVATFEPTPLRIIGPPGTKEVVGHILASLGPDIGYRLAHHADLEQPPLLEITETDGAGLPDVSPGAVRVTTAPTDHRPVEPSIAFRFDHDGVRLQDTLDYHSSPEEAAQTAERAGMGTLVLTHYVPAIPAGGGDDWRQLAAQHFTGRVELGDDLHHITIT